MSKKDSKQRTRSTNFTNDDKLLALNIIKKYSNVLESKTTGAFTWKEKDQTWDKIEEEYNSQSSSAFRSKDTLKKFYENKKRETRKICAEEKKQIYMTGGGLPNINIKYDATVEITKEMMNKKTVEGLNNPFDGDSLEVNIDSVLAEPTEILIANEEIDEDASISLLNPINWANYKIQNLKTPISQELRNKETEQNTSKEQSDEILNTPNTADKCSQDYTPSSTKQKKAPEVSEWRNRRRPKPELHASSISKQYSDLAEVKLELAKLELAILKSSHEARMRREEEEHNLKLIALRLDIKIKEHILKKHEYNM